MENFLSDEWSDKELNEWNTVDSTLRYAEEEGLLTEVVLFGMKALKENPSMSISEAILFGLNEWVK